MLGGFFAVRRNTGHAHALGPVRPFRALEAESAACWDAGIERTGMHDTLDGVGREGSGVYAGVSARATRNVNADHHARVFRATFAPHPCV